MPAPAAAVPAVISGDSSGAGSSPSATPSETRANWHPLWTRPTPDIASVSLSPDGGSIAWVDRAGSIRRMTASDGRTVYRTTALPGINRVVALANGAGILGYARMNPASTTVHLLDGATGSKDTTFGVSGAIWNAAAGTGNRVVVGTGRSLLYVLPIPAGYLPTAGTVAAKPAQPATAISAAMSGTKSGAPAPKTIPALLPPPPQPLKIDSRSIPESLALGSSGEPVALVGTWEDTGIGLWGLDGTSRWLRREDQADRTYDVRLSADGSVAVAVSSRGVHHVDARLHVWNAHTGQLLWSQDLKACDPRVAVNANGSVIAISYERDIDGDGTFNDSAERRLLLFDRVGHRAFPEKGGLFFAPQLVALSADGQRVTVRDDSGMLWTLDNKGRILSRVRLPLDPKTGAPPVVQETISSTDGSMLLVRRGDGQITLFKAVLP